MELANWYTDVMTSNNGCLKGKRAVRSESQRTKYARPDGRAIVTENYLEAERYFVAVERIAMSETLYQSGEHSPRWKTEILTQI